MTTSEDIHFHSAIRAPRDLARDVRDMLGEIGERIPLSRANIGILFCSPHFEEELEGVLRQIREVSPEAILLGCTAEGTIGASREIFTGPSISILMGVWPDAEIEPFHVTQDWLENADSQEAWVEKCGLRTVEDATLLAVADPFSVDISRFVAGLNERFSGLPLYGGIASGAERRGENGLVISDQVVREGVVGLRVRGRGARIRGLVSQGCRPIGRPFVVTRAKGPVIFELGGKPAVAQLSDVFSDLDTRDQELAQRALHLGRAMTEYKERLGHGDFLIQNLRGFVEETGAIAIYGEAKVGSTVQFHVRDGQSAEADLKSLVERHRSSLSGRRAHAALLFDCNGRGRRMWPNQPDHDIRIVEGRQNGLPCAGFFCGGEFGPVGGSNFVHGFTASLAFIEDAAEEVSGPDAPKAGSL